MSQPRAGNSRKGLLSRDDYLAPLPLNAGGSFIRITPAGVTLVGPSIRQNAGGSAGRGSGATALLPEAVIMADGGPAGRPLAAPVTGAATIEVAAAQRDLAQMARSLGASRCPVCETCMEVHVRFNKYRCPSGSLARRAATCWAGTLSGD